MAKSKTPDPTPDENQQEGQDDLLPGENANMTVEQIYARGWSVDIPFESGSANPRPLRYASDPEPVDEEVPPGDEAA